MRFELLTPEGAITDSLRQSVNWRRIKSSQWQRPAPPKTPKSSPPSLASLRIYPGRPPNRGRWLARNIATIPGGIYRIELTAKSSKQETVNPDWFAAGWMNLYFDGAYLSSIKVPLGLTLFSVWPRNQYLLTLKPVNWVPSLKLNLEEFTGELPVLDESYNIDAGGLEESDYGNITDAGYV